MPSKSGDLWWMAKHLRGSLKPFIYIFFNGQLRVWFIFCFGTFSLAQITAFCSMTYSVPTEGVRCVNRAPMISLFTRYSFCHLPRIGRNTISSTLTIDKLYIEVYYVKNKWLGSWRAQFAGGSDTFISEKNRRHFSQSWLFVKTRLSFLLILKLTVDIPGPL